MSKKVTLTVSDFVYNEILEVRPETMTRSEHCENMILSAWRQRLLDGNTSEGTEKPSEGKNAPAKNRTLLKVEKWFNGQKKGADEGLASDITDFFEHTLTEPRVFVEPVVFVRGIEAFDQSFVRELLQRVAHCALVCAERANEVGGDQWLVEEHESLMSDSSAGYETHQFIHINLNNVCVFIRTYYEHRKNTGYVCMGVGQVERELEEICNVHIENRPETD